MKHEGFGHRQGHSHEPADAGCCGVFGRRFYSTAEKIESLVEYRDELEKELAGVKEKIAELKRK